jgi:nucleoside-triphosphatase
VLKKRLLFITGSPGTGKTSVLLKTIEVLKARGCSAGGMVSREVRAGGARVGFEILDLSSGRRGLLAHVNQKHGPRIGKYRVNLEDLDNIGAEAIATAVENADVVAIDEIGPMELHSERFKEAVKKAVESRRLVLGTVHWKERDRLIQEIKAREDAEIYKVTYENRGNLHEIIIEKAAEFLARNN